MWRVVVGRFEAGIAHQGKVGEMKNQFDGVVVNELRRFEASLEAIARNLRGKQILTPSEKSLVQDAYSSLKEELRAAKKYGTVGGAKRQQSETERLFFSPAVNRALQSLTAPTNSNPLTSRWRSGLFGAQHEISYRLHGLEKYLAEGN